MVIAVNALKQNLHSPVNLGALAWQADAMIGDLRICGNDCDPETMCVIAIGGSRFYRFAHWRNLDHLPPRLASEGWRVFVAQKWHFGLCLSKAVLASVCKKPMMCSGTKHRPEGVSTGAGVQPPDETRSSHTGPSARARLVNLIRSFGPLLLQPSNDTNASDI